MTQKFKNFVKMHNKLNFAKTTTMKNSSLESEYEKLYSSDLRDIAKNLESFIKSKEQNYHENRSKTKED